MRSLAAVGDRINGGVHCHGHDHGPRPTPGTIVTGSTKVLVEGRPVARANDSGHSPSCCAGVGKILLQPTQTRVMIEGRAAVAVGSQTLHCGMAPGVVISGSSKVLIP